MSRLALGFGLGVLALLHLPSLPSAWLALAAVPVLWLCCRLRRPLPAGALLGLCCAWAAAQHGLDQRLPAHLDGADFIAAGTVVSLPDRDDGRVRFNLRVESLVHEHGPVSGPARVRLTWYRAAPGLEPGQRWRLPVRLKRPRGYANPGGFDYERWLLREGIGATGYVTDPERAALLDEDAGAALAGLRLRLSRAIHEAARSETESALLRALVVGDRRGLTQSMWHVLNATGTSHLVAISGLHVGLVAALGLALGQGVARGFPRLVHRAPARLWGAAAALGLALVYAGLAGFSLPTRRALAMVAVALGAVIMRRAVRPWQALACAWLAVLALDPLAPLGAGFWLSFGAVGALLAVYGGRCGRVAGWRPWSGAQWVVALGLLPLLAVQFQRVSLVAPLVNTLAIPLVGLAAVPLALAGTAALALPGPLGEVLLLSAGTVLALFWQGAESVASMPRALVPVPEPGFAALVCGGAGAAWLLAPRGFPARALGAVLLVPLFVAGPVELPHGAFRLAVLDVGQGSAAVVRTRTRALVFDTGPVFRSGFHTARAVVDPFLRRAGVSRLDALILSHGDSDHAGGARWLARRYPVRRVLAGEPDGGEPCLEGERWTWDGVRFQILHPPRGMPYRGNASSCVLRVAGAGGSALLTGDITRVVERRLVAVHREALEADILLAPHHGSDTSSSPPFIAAVAPEWVVFSVGWNNRFGLPKPEVVDRYRKATDGLLFTAESGLVRFDVTPGQGISEPLRWRVDRARFWTDASGH